MTRKIRREYTFAELVDLAREDDVAAYALDVIRERDRYQTMYLRSEKELGDVRRKLEAIAREVETVLRAS